MRLVASNKHSARFDLRFTLANFIRCRRQHVKLSIEDAAELSGIATEEWVAIEDGYLPEPGSITLHCIARVIEVRTRSLLQLSSISRA
jgi:hypothetical protein